MKAEELKQLTQKAMNGEADANDAVLILSAMFESSSKHLKQIKTHLDDLSKRVETLESAVDRVSSHTADWVFRAVVEE